MARIEYTNLFMDYGYKTMEDNYGDIPALLSDNMGCILTYLDDIRSYKKNKVKDSVLGVIEDALIYRYNSLFECIVTVMRHALENSSYMYCSSKDSTSMSIIFEYSKYKNLEYGDISLLTKYRILRNNVVHLNDKTYTYVLKNRADYLSFINEYIKLNNIISSLFSDLGMTISW